MAKISKTSVIFAILLIAAILCVYIPGLNNQLIFDDLRLAEGDFFGAYGNLLQFKQRMLSYGSFVWIQNLFGEGWWKQHLFNILLHVLTVGALYALFKSLLERTQFPHDIEQEEHFQASRMAALRVGLIVFALNPVAVYVVGYLIQRSILMATLFAVLACFAYVRGLSNGGIGWYVAAVVCYVAAALSKEQSALTVAMAVPLYIYVRRPSWKKILMVSGATAVVLVLAVGAVLSIYGSLIGALIDNQSVAYVKQLEAISPGITSKVYGLSILNQAALFFVYGFLWVVPYVGGMSIDIRPAFPVSYGSALHLIGAIAFVALLAASIWAVLRKDGVLRFAALCLLFPMLWFFTEFAVVWVQDPLVLYRSYLWAVGIPGLVAIVLTGFKPRTIYIVGVFLTLLFGGLAMERVMSMRDAETVWEDAASKVDLKAPANAVGRYRPYLNLGTERMERGRYAQAERDFMTADALNDLNGNARFSIGVSQLQQKKYPDAIRSFKAAEEKGYSGQTLWYQRAEAYAALGHPKESFDAFSTALQAGGPDVNDSTGATQLTEQTHLRRAEMGMTIQKYDEAVKDYETVLKSSPNNSRAAVGLAMALTGKGESAKAKEQMDALIAKTPSGPAFYARAMAQYGLKNIAEALKDLDQATQADPANAQRYAMAKAQISGASAPKQ
ncbi:tetratricopeptide repeat protein [Diaphorobacter sp. HDW4B]|uniref:tetratricopeptide repeat protein n=1 Tax=Diaphorobacter sp. HDW4B TaxID=2714925 RepID=UPI0014086D88|nr:tetratricopeptide repeat protein [Diaphorobacter sp. HDW4B]QIL70087.1 tetratricopeptide repeat protein [Diaphorobacter sp. HDW4B]